MGYEQQPYSECPPQQPYVPNSFQQQYVPPQQVEATNGPSYRGVMILMGEVIEKLESMHERLRVDQRCRNIEQEWYENKQILSDIDEGLSCFLLELWIWWSCLRKLFENSHWTLR